MLALNWRHLGWTPVLLHPDGSVMREALVYVVRGKRRGSSFTTLYRQALAISRMADFWHQYHSEVADESLLSAYFEALGHGDDKLGWKGTISATAVQYLKYLNGFFDWWALETNRPSPNPLVEERMGWVSIVAEMHRKHEHNILAGIVPNQPEGKNGRKVRSVAPEKEAVRNARSNGRPKAMDLLDYMKLIKYETDPRNRALWLLLGAGGRRISEAVHVFVPYDIGLNPRTGEARVKIADPRYGKIEVEEDGRTRWVTRQEYLRKYHRMKPRVLERPGSGTQAGWKGIREDNSVAKSKEVVWMAPQLGELMWQTHKEYMAAREDTGAEHPFYFLNTKRNKGAPLTISNAKGLLRAACKRLGITSRTNLHSLRHVFGNFLACELAIQQHLITLAFGHRSPASAAVYTVPTNEQLRKAIVKAQQIRKAARKAQN